MLKLMREPRPERSISARLLPPDLRRCKAILLASWEGLAPPGRGGVAQAPRGSLKVVTTNLKPGYLRKNGVPYSDKTVVTEYYDLVTEPDGIQWLILQTTVEDPTYLNQPFITSTHFRKQADGAGWSPSACAAR